MKGNTMRDFDSNATISERLTNLCKGMTAVSMLHYARNDYSFGHDVYGFSIGKKYARVFYDMSNGQRAVAFFVDMNDGTVWKADGWKKPALNFPRGNVWSLQGQVDLLNEKANSNSGYGGF